jgi:hypothetical protein
MGDYLDSLWHGGALQLGQLSVLVSLDLLNRVSMDIADIKSRQHTGSCELHAFCKISHITLANVLSMR